MDDLSVTSSGNSSTHKSSTQASGKSSLQLWLEAIHPNHTFDEKTPPLEPDYTDDDMWAAKPGKLGNAALTPEGIERTNAEDTLADVFYIHPTTYVGTRTWNAAIGGNRADEVVDHVIMPGQASIFNGSCRIFAPRYRQATLSVFFNPSESGRAALDLAFRDVRRAFKHFIDVENGGRPFFIAGHSQGCAMAMRLLAEEFDDPALKERFIAAYLIGFKVTDENVKDMAHIAAPATAADDTGVFVAYDTFLEGTDALHQPDAAEHWAKSGWFRRAATPVKAINPLNWKADGAHADKSLHKGICTPVPNDMNLLPKLYAAGADTPLGLKCSGLIGPMLPGTDAQLDEHGFLKISKPEQAPLNAGIFGGNYHNLDMALFYMNLRENIAARLETFLG
ncbi:DUF3089 domain-containing protein [Kordiimonas sp. SCSIO 12603]|uniref:DUF3089 domain-containing protein n=1 Tax=Kordiimonas sp. SCSIO 12603 TaxID=2829596 RepID=UPI0021026AED|nr:DUF3089 domain-containing protein [Kordiimonas sp. SCSIO 12603]UTW59908.1 DUF3089 domain-containing protein [Kordiimonas sp. SCSIO 12603]